MQDSLHRNSFKNQHLVVSYMNVSTSSISHERERPTHHLGWRHWWQHKRQTSTHFTVIHCGLTYSPLVNITLDENYSKWIFLLSNHITKKTEEELVFDLRLHLLFSFLHCFRLSESSLSRRRPRGTGPGNQPVTSPSRVVRTGSPKGILYSVHYPGRVESESPTVYEWSTLVVASVCRPRVERIGEE